ncbi:type VII secretion protein EccB [Dactylosporangium matsuzakiense]|uniref:Type VII secretion protein EccB n=1 Tax=Dactylosporangium matsuzakiense TaxID=53360 RepID=A0A9W6KHC1_9ACTN|nr:type VII secretion protein EccB [Dactylosporangium matsuzakiense]UWZ41151.1 type VII secretion protein EccB [Dactylosporangium matsuzakiense]GLL00937.1 type VII secretion protein EccB [Dactylosporangium matsuzakiense]
MRTRSEQVQAHRFVTRRIVSALLSGEPETTDLPMRRLGLAIFGSVMLATIVFAAFGIYGQINPGGGSVEENSIVIEEESGARFVYLQGRLYPVLNYASARLIMGSATPSVSTVSSKKLRDIPRGVPVGIAGAPDSLPDAKSLLGLPWQVCEGPRSASTATLTTSLLIGSAVPDGAGLGDEGMLMQLGTDGATFVLLHGVRLKVPAGQSSGPVRAALNLSAVRPVVVDDAFVNALPAGPDLAVPVIPGKGGASQKKISGASVPVGTLYRSNNVYYVMLAQGLATIGEVTADLLVAGGAARPTELAPAVAGAALANVDFDPPGMPRTLWTMRQVPAGTTVCAKFAAGQSDPAAQTLTVDLHGQIPGALAQITNGDVSAPRNGIDGVLSADRVVIAGGHGALVRLLPVPGSDAVTTVYLITDQGIKYPLAAGPKSGDGGAGPAGGGAQASLGFGDVKPVPIDRDLLALVPTGPTLDPAAALSFLPAGNVAATPSVRSSG